MRELPILFSGAMVRALLDGRKTQTRRVVNPEPSAGVRVSPFCASGLEDGHGRELRSPYGKPGDRLWVRETWAQPTTLDPGPTVYRADYPACVPAGFENVPAAEAITWKPSIHMPRALARLTLEVTGVRVERLQDISADDARAEGLEYREDYIAGRACRRWRSYGSADGWFPEGRDIAPIHSFQTLWDGLNAERGFRWTVNPWVWVVEFKRIEA
ncbi:hypothetical protein J8I87_06180 [Paraburkholderia sp. LEh10]|uniref:hypothetical protein n=1 Tax=Paraburkholderia sp. LEh10 TaxID=2821353 RepID=UPI001AE50645|nr:hypothetical protein [Paraburkholderia sp. LEh10]